MRSNPLSTKQTFTLRSTLHSDLEEAAEIKAIDTVVCVLGHVSAARFRQKMSARSLSRRIMHVDDDPAVLRLISHLLSERGYMVDSVSDSRQAMATLQSTGASVVLLDIDMPHMNGLELLQQIKSCGGYIPVIMLTGLVTQMSLVDALSQGAEYCLFKPIVDFNKLTEALTLTYKKLSLWREAMLELRDRQMGEIVLASAY